MPERQLLGRSLPSRELSRFPARRGFPAPQRPSPRSSKDNAQCCATIPLNLIEGAGMKIPAPSRCLILPSPTARCCGGDLGPNPSRPATAPPLSERAVSASGEADIDQLSGMPSRQPTMGERHTLPAGMRNPVTSVIRSSLGLSAPKRCLPSSSRSRFGGASETSPS